MMTLMLILCESMAVKQVPETLAWFRTRSFVWMNDISSSSVSEPIRIHKKMME